MRNSKSNSNGITTSSNPIFGWPNILSPHGYGNILDDVWPSVFWGPERLDAMKQQLEASDWTRGLIDRLLVEAEALLKEEPLVPIAHPGWRHDFFSPTTGEHLLFDRKSPHAHVDPWDQRVYRGDPFDEAWTLLMQENTYRQTRGVAVLYGITGDERYAKWVATGLEKARQYFTRHDLREDRKSSVLYDSQKLTLLCNAYEWTRHSTEAYDPASHDRLRSDLFEAPMEAQLDFVRTRGTHNMTCYAAASAYFLGQSFGKADWIDLALFHPEGGFFALLDSGVPASDAGEVDGFWYEGSMFYHYYSVAPLLSLAAAILETPYTEQAGARPCLSPEDLRERLARMLLAPYYVSDDELRLPPFGDLGSPTSLKIPLYRHLYEMGAAVLQHEELTAVLSAIYATGIPRGHLTSLAFGPAEIPSVRERASKYILPAAKIASLRSNGLHVYLKTGTTPQGHDHHDRLSFGLSALGTCLLPDIGTPGYALREFKQYCMSALAHNTMMVNDDPKQLVDHATLDTATSNLSVVGALKFEGGAVPDSVGA